MSYSPIADPQGYHMRQDKEHLNLLAIFHYIMGGLTLLGGLGSLLYVIFGTVMLHGATNWNANAKDPLPNIVGGLFAGFGIIVVLSILIAGALIIHTGRCLANHRGQTFIYIVSALNCLNMPLGTALGVCTFVVLSRPTVKALFDPKLAMASEMNHPTNGPTNNSPWYRG